MAGLVLHLLEQHLLGLRCAQTGDPLELAQVLALAFLEQLALVVELAVAVVEPLLAPAQLGQLGVDRLLLGDHSFLDADDLAAALEQVGLEFVAGHGGRRGDRRGPCSLRGRAPVEQRRHHQSQRQQCRCDHDCHACSLTAGPLHTSPVAVLGLSASEGPREEHGAQSSRRS